MHGNFGESLSGSGHFHVRDAASIDLILEGGDCGTEAILALYCVHGADFVRHLDGSFAIALHDRERDVRLLARDAAGSIPLYYATTPSGETVFGTRIADILPHLGRVAPNPRKIQDFFAFFWSIDDETWFEGVYQVPQGGVWIDGVVTRHFNFERVPEERPADEWKAAIIETLRGAIQRNAERDQVGCHLSGGIDSSLIVALMTQQAGAAPPAYVASFPEYPAFDESPYAQQVADRYGALLHRVPSYARDFSQLLEHVMRAMEEPKAHPPVWPRYQVERQIHVDGLTTILTGRGADELFTGYDAHKQAQLANHRERRMVFSEEERAALFRGALAGDYRPEECYDAVFASCPGETLLEQCMAFDWRTLMGNWMALDYKLSGAFGTTICAPFLDRAVIDLAMRIPIDLLCPGDVPKQLLREATALVLPEEIVWRPKVGFRTPMGEMLRDGALEPFVRDTLKPDDSAFWEFFEPAGVEVEIDRHFSGASNRGWQLWALLTTRTWFGLFIDARDAGAPASV